MNATLTQPTQPVSVVLPAQTDWSWRLRAVGCLLLLAVAVTMRCWKLDHLPGVNGDEAWYGVQAELIVHSEPIAWRTPTGNPLNPFFLLPEALLHALFLPSVALLRIPAVVSGLSALLINFVFSRRVWNLRAAAISTCLLAVLPIDIAYSRFAWDASQTLLASLLVIYPALLSMRESERATRWRITAGLALIVAILVHPTNLFLCPFVAWPLLNRWRDPIFAATLRYKTGLVISATLTLAALFAFNPEFLHRHDPLLFAWRYLRLLSGQTVYTFIVDARAAGLGGDAAWNVWDAVGGAMIAMCGYGLYRRFRQRPDGVDQLLIEGSACAILAFYLVAGPAGLAANFERYGLCLIAPAGLLMTRGAQWWLIRRVWQAEAAAWGFLLLAACMLSNFYVHYFQELTVSGGNAHVAFRTARQEPKQAALELILAATQPNQPVRIVAGSWWTYWPLRYLAFAEPRVRVQSWIEFARAGSKIDSGVDAPWFVDFLDTEPGSQGEQHRAQQLLMDAHGAAEQHIIRDAQGRALISILH